VTKVARIVTQDGDLQQAVAGQSVTLTLADEVDCSRGDVIAVADAPDVADQFQVTLIWMHEQPMLGGAPYLMKIGGKTIPVTFAAPKYKINVNTLEHLAAKELALNEIGVCNLSSSQPIAFDAYKDNRETGSFILIDRLSNATVGAGLIDFSLRRSQNIHMQHVNVNQEARSERLHQKPACYGLPVCRALANPPLPICSKPVCMRVAGIPICSTATTCATASIATLASPMQTAWKTFVASLKWASCLWTPG
jgi:bifunctional enzyme CysN/CysC